MTKATRLTAWVMTVATAGWLAVPSAVAQTPIYQYEWVSQSGTISADGLAHQYTGVDAGDTIDLSLTLINRSGTTIKGTSALGAIPTGKQVQVGAWGIGTQNPQDGTPSFLDTSSFVLNNNRFMYYDGADVPNGGQIKFDFDVKMDSDLADGTYKLYVRPVSEYNAWTRQYKNGQTFTSGNSDIFWAFVVGSGSSSSGNLEGGAGDITVSALSLYSAEEVGEDEEDVKVMAVEIEADDSSDVEVNSMKVEFYQDTAADSQRLEDYASEVSIWQDGEEVGRADTEDFSESNDYYSKSISFDGAIIDAGDKSKFVVAVTGKSTLDSGDIDDDDWSVDLISTRFTDGDGVTTTEAGDAAATDGAGTFEKNFDFASFAEATDITLKVALNDDEDDINEAHVIDIDDTDVTKDVELVAFTIEADGDSGLHVTQIPAVITTSVGDESTVMANAQLWFEGDAIASDNIDNAGALLFTDLDIDIDAGEMGEFIITADLEDTADAQVANGDTYQCSVTAANALAIVAEDDSGNRIADGDAAGSAIGGTHAGYDAGISVKFVSSTASRTFTADATGEDDQGTFKITFDVTAFDDDMYIDSSSEVGPVTATGTYTIDNGAILAGEIFTATINGTAVAYTVLADDLDDGGVDVDALAVANKIATAIDANGTVGPLVNAVVTSGAGTETITLTATTPGTTGNYTTVAADDSVGATFAAGAAAMASGAAAANVAGQGVEFSTVETTGMLPTMASDILSSTTVEDEDVANGAGVGAFEVEEGTTRRFTLTVIYTADSVPNDGSMYVSLDNINWKDATTAEAAGGVIDADFTNYYTFNLGDFKTSYLFLNGIA